MKHVDLCSGIGGFALGFEWAGLSTPVLFCDIEPWSRRVLAKHWPDVPIAEDVKELASDPERFVPDCDILTAGYPCQPFSLAGKQRGTQDDRHIWPYLRTIVAQKRPAWCVFENVYGHVALGLDEVLADLEAEDYATRTFVVPACSVDAPHRRDRIWIVAHANSNGEPDVTGPDQEGQRMEQTTHDDANTNSKRSHRTNQHQLGNNEPADRQERELGQVCEVLAGQGNPAIGGTSDVGDSSSSRRSGDVGRQSKQESANGCTDVADTDNTGCIQQRRTIPTQQKHQAAQCRSEWLPEPAVGRVAYGIPGRVDRLRGLGNAIVPQLAMQIGTAIKGFENATRDR